MTPQRWKGAGIVFLVITVLLVIAALVSVFGGVTGPVPYGAYQSQLQFIPEASLFGVGSGVLRGVVLGCFAGIGFFTGLVCFLWSGVLEAKEQRAELLVEVAALRANIEKNADKKAEG